MFVSVRTNATNINADERGATPADDYSRELSRATGSLRRGCGEVSKLPSAGRGRDPSAAREASLTREETAAERIHVAFAFGRGFGVRAQGREGGRAGRAGPPPPSARRCPSAAT